MSTRAKIGLIATVVILIVLLRVLTGTGEEDHYTQSIRDQQNVANVCELLTEHYEGSPPEGADGRIDVYQLVRDGYIERQLAEGLFYSYRYGAGPSLAEIESGDYQRFPYARATVRPGATSGRVRPLLWDLKPDLRRDNLVLVGFSDGHVSWLERSDFPDR